MIGEHVKRKHIKRKQSEEVGSMDTVSHCGDSYPNGAETYSLDSKAAEKKKREG